MEKKRSHFWSITVVAIVVAVYIMSAASATNSAFSSDPIYRRDSGVFVECAVRWDASRLMSIAQKAADELIPITFFVTADYCAQKKETISALADMGHGIGVLLECEPSDFDRELVRAREAFDEVGVQIRYAMADDDAFADALHNAAAEYGMEAVCCTFDVRNTATDGGVLVERVRSSVFSGAIVRMEPTMVIDSVFGEMIDAIREKGLTFQLLDQEGHT